MLVRQAKPEVGTTIFTSPPRDGKEILHGVDGVIDRRRSCRVPRVVFRPMMRNDSVERARAEAAPFEGLQVVHVWDPKRRVGHLFTKALRLRSTVWDFYFLYASGVRWEGNEPPQPTFWMHQLPSASGADRDLVLYPTKFSRELLRLLGDGVEPSHTSRDDLGLDLHWDGLLNLTRERAEYTIEDVRDAFENSKTVRRI